MEKIEIDFDESEFVVASSKRGFYKPRYFFDSTNHGEVKHEQQSANKNFLPRGKAILLKIMLKILPPIHIFHLH